MSTAGSGIAEENFEFRQEGARYVRRSSFCSGGKVYISWYPEYQHTKKYQEDAYISLVFLCKQIVFFFGSVLTSESDPLIPGGRDMSISGCL